MKSDFVIALTQLAAERNLPKEIVISAIEAALVSAYRKDSIAAGQNISVKLDPGTGEISVYVLKNVVEEVADPQQEISVAEARRARPNAQVGDTIATDSLSHTAGRIAAQTAKQVVMQRLREAERELVFEEYADKAGEVFSIAIQRIEPRNIVVELGRAEASLPYNEQVPQERYRVGQKIKALLKSVQRSGKGPELIMSRADPLLLRRLFEMEVPEIYNGAVEIVAIAREAGSRSKVAVRAKQDGVDPVGSCVGLRGVRIQNIVNELHGEKIDVVEWSKEQARFIANALNPSQVMRVELDASEQIALAIVPDRQLSLAIGKEGQNARLAAKLTGWKVDIKSNVEAEVILAEKAKARAEKAAPVVAEKVAVEAQPPVVEPVPVAQEQPEKAVAEAPAVVEEAVTVVEQV
ncbi:MAG: transcription termination factor NusA, partial [Chloroflexi bacterium]|nr:transcription termination factor NusA [Chloroflexota bacterium]